MYVIMEYICQIHTYIYMSICTTIKIAIPANLWVEHLAGTHPEGRQGCVWCLGQAVECDKHIFNVFRWGKPQHCTLPPCKMQTCRCQMTNICDAQDTVNTQFATTAMSRCSLTPSDQPTWWIQWLLVTWLAVCWWLPQLSKVWWSCAEVKTSRCYISWLFWAWMTAFRSFE